MKLAMTAAALAATALALPVASLGRTPEFKVPEFAHLRAKATETVDVNVGGFLLGLARMFAGAEKDNDPDLQLLENIQSVKVRSYTFDSDNAYSKSDVEAVRRQLRSPAWNSLVQVHKRDAREDVDVFLCMEDNHSCGLAVIATQPRELTIVHIAGDIDIDKLAKLEGEFGIPKLGDKPDTTPEN